MSHLTSKTERKAIKVLANTLRFFEDTDLLFVSAEDAHKAREAENILRSIIENNGYTARYQKGKGTRILKDKKPKYHANELF
jgi:deoxyxylulose-5-phosphate synthase